MAKVKITQVKSKNGATDRQIANLVSLGIHRLHHTLGNWSKLYLNCLMESVDTE